MKTIRDFWSDETGQGLPEYGLLVAAVAVMVVLVSVLFTGAVGMLFNDIADYIENGATLAT